MTTVLQNIISQGGTAFPHTMTDQRQTAQFSGLTVLDYYAGQALAGYLSGRNTDERNTNKEALAESCYAYAQAMVDELVKRNTPKENPG